MSILLSVRGLKPHFSIKERADLMPALSLDGKEQKL